MKINLSLFKVIDWFLFILPILFTILGIVIIYSLTYYSNIKLYHNQIIFATVGLVLMLVFTFLDYRQLKSSALIIYLIGIGFLILVLILGKTSFGATRWINLGFFEFQPSEIFKLILIIFLSSYLSNKLGNINLKNIVFVIIVTLIPTILVMLQPDLGTSIVFILILVSLLFASKLKSKYILLFVIIFVISAPILWFNLKDYQKQRIETFITPTKDLYGTGYNINQALITIGSGGVWGKGFGQGPQSQLNFLPVAHTDFVFAGMAEAIGFAGSAIFLIFFCVFLIRVFNVARISKDNFGSLIAIGIGTIILFQMIINIGMNLGLMPVTGIPLPFVSAGGSSLIFILICVGILQSIYIRHKKIRF